VRSWSPRGTLEGILTTNIHGTSGEHFRSMFAERSWSGRRMFKSMEFEHSATTRSCECSNIRRIFSEESMLLGCSRVSVDFNFVANLNSKEPKNRLSCIYDFDSISLNKQSKIVYLKAKNIHLEEKITFV